MKKNPCVPNEYEKSPEALPLSNTVFCKMAWVSLGQHELLLYLFLVIVGDRNGLSYYGYDKICTLMRMSVDEYVLARNTLIEKDLIAFDGRMFQVLALPERPVITPSNCMSQQDMEKHDPATVGQLVAQSLRCKNGRVG